MLRCVDPTPRPGWPQSQKILFESRIDVLANSFLLYLLDWNVWLMELLVTNLTQPELAICDKMDNVFHAHYQRNSNAAINKADRFYNDAIKTREELNNCRFVTRLGSVNITNDPAALQWGAEVVSNRPLYKLLTGAQSMTEGDSDVSG